MQAAVISDNEATPSEYDLEEQHAYQMQDQRATLA